MKTLKNSFVLTAIAVLGIVSCNEASLTPDLVPEEGKLVTVHFGTENTDPSTKATLTPNEGETAFEADWENEDKISVKYSNDSETENATGTTTATWNGTSFESKMPEYTGLWIYDAAYPVPSELDSSVDFGPNRTQKGNAYNSKYDIMIGSAVAEDAAAGKDNSGKDIIFQMERKTAIAYFHFTSTLDEAVTSATLTVSGDGAAIASTSASVSNFAWNPAEDCQSITITFPEEAPNAQDFKLWFNVLETPYMSMSLTVETATKTFTISKNTEGVYEAGKLYKVKKENIAWTDKPVTDVITADKLAAITTSYTDFSEVKISSNAVYAGNNAKTTGGAIQLRSDNSVSGIVSTTSGGKVTKVSVEWASNTTNGRVINVYGNTNPYTSASELYSTTGNTNQGTKIGTIVKGTSTELVIDGNYPYIGIRSNNGALYLNSVSITWEPAPDTYTVSCATVTGGTLSATPSKAEAGAEVSLKATPEEGYNFNNVWTVTNAETSEVIDVTDGKFTMPAANVTVSASFSKVDYTITKTESERGSIVAKKGETVVETAQMGDEITLTATPNDGFVLTSWAVVDSKGTVIDVVDNKFTMPASDVMITATFISTASYTVSFSVNGNVTTKSYKETEKIEFPDVPAQDGVQFVGWVNSDFSGIVSTKPELVDVNTAVMGTTDIFYYAVFAENEIAVFDPNDISDTPAVSGQNLTWKHTATGVTLKLSDGQLYTNGSPKTFTVTKGTSYYFQIGSDNNYTISEIVTTISETKYSISKVSTGASLSTSGTTQIVKSDNLTSIQCFATSSYQIRATNITVKVITGYSTKIIALNEVVVSGTPAKTEYTVNDAFDPTGLTVKGTYSDGSNVDITEGISWNCTPATFTEAGSKTVSVIATVKSVASEAYDVYVTVNTILNTLKATDGTVDVNKTLDVSTLFTSNSDAEVTYTLVENPSNAGTLSGSSFSATAAGTYKVKASQAETAKYSAAEATATITVNTLKLTPPANLKCSEKTENSLTFTWDAVANASGYKVSLDGTSYGETQQETTYTINNLSAGTSQTIYVKAIGNTSAYTDSDAVRVTDKTTGGDTDWSSTYSSNIKLSASGGTKATSAKVKIAGAEYSAMKLGSSGNAGNFTISVPAGATKLYLFAAGWNGKTNTITLSGANVSPSDAKTLTADSGVSGTSTTYTIAGTPSTYFFEFSFDSSSSAQDIKISCSERCVVWGVNAN